MTSPLCTHLIPEDQCLHCLSPALRVAIDALARERAEVARLRADNERLRNAAIYARCVLDKIGTTEDALIASDTLKAALAAGGEK